MKHLLSLKKKRFFSSSLKFEKVVGSIETKKQVKIFHSFAFTTSFKNNCFFSRH